MQHANEAARDPPDAFHSLSLRGPEAAPNVRSFFMASAAETVKSSSEHFAAAGNKAFKDSFEKSFSTLTELNTQSKQNFEAFVASVTAATKGAEALGAHAVAFSRKTVEDQVAAAKTLAGAKSVQEVIELQTGFAKTAFETYVAEMNKMAETVAASVKESASPINERVSAFVERVQAAR
jgi:phasin family protein